MVRSRYRLTRLGGVIAVLLAGGLLGGVPANAISSGSPAADGAYPFTAKIAVGSGDTARACTGALVAPAWVITARSCFDEPGRAAATGTPAKPTTVTVGRASLSAAGGRTVAATWLVAHPDRDVALVRLATLVSTITPVVVSATGPAAGESLLVAGFGRTATEWVPDRLHVAPVTVQTVGTTTVDITGQSSGVTTCKGDAGGPALRDVGGTVQMVALHHTSWQGGCLGETGTRPEAVETRVDDLRTWITQNTPATCGSAADFNGDCRTDLIGQFTDGRLAAWRSTGTIADNALFPSPGAIVYGGGWTPSSVQRIIPGDFNGDGRTDLIGQFADGRLRVWPSSGTIAENQLFTGPAIYVGSGWTASSVQRIIPGDFNGDGRTDLIGQLPDGRLRAWQSTGTVAENQLFSAPVYVYGGGWKPNNVQRIVPGDFNGDGRTDLIAQFPDGALSAWPSTGTIAENALFPSPGVSVYGSGWSTSNVERIVPGDFNGDGRTDLIAQFADGRLGAWASTGTIMTNKLFLSPTTIVYGGGWTPSSVQRIIPGDFNGDGRTDLIGQFADGRLRAWASSGTIAENQLFTGPAIYVYGGGWTSSSIPRIVPAESSVS